jgi:hypothetical protein
MFSAITGAIGALKGPLHGGANEESQKMAEEVGKPENAEAYVRDRLANHEKIMGFGHAVYRTMDPRARILKELCRQLGERRDQPQWYEIFSALEETTMAQKGLYPNVDLYAAGVYHMLGVPTDLMTPLFALARMAGWTAHVRDQYLDNRIIRQRQKSVVGVGDSGNGRGGGFKGHLQIQAFHRGIRIAEADQVGAAIPQVRGRHSAGHVDGLWRPTRRIRNVGRRGKMKASIRFDRIHGG